MAAEDLKEIARRFWEEMFNQDNLDALDEIFATGFKLHDLVYKQDHSLDELKEIIYDTRSVVPGTQVVVQDQALAEGDRVVTTFRVYVPPPGRAVQDSVPGDEGWEYIGMSISRISDGKIEETWILWEARLADQELRPTFVGDRDWRWPPWKK